MMHRAMSEVAQKNKIPVLNLHQEFHRQTRQRADFFGGTPIIFPKLDTIWQPRFLAAESIPILAQIPDCRKKPIGH